jgi:hypothetical protein
MRCILGGIFSTVILILTSTLIHGFIFASTWTKVSFMRPTDNWPFMPGAPIATLIWNIILAWGFTMVYKSIPGTGLRKGFNYAMFLYILFIPFIEVWNYLQLELPFMAVIAGCVCYLISFPLSGIIFAKVYGNSLEHK